MVKVKNRSLYDRMTEVDALSITFRETTVTTKHLTEGIAADYDSAGRLAGLDENRFVRRSRGDETLIVDEIQRVLSENNESPYVTSYF